MVHIYNGILLRHKRNKPESVELRWTNLEPIIQSKVSQNEKNKCHILTHRKWQPTPVFLPGESQGRGSLVGYRLWGHTESDTTEVT